MSSDAVNTLLQSLRSLRKSSDYSDLKILCGDEVFPVHKAIICPRSDFFMKACSWGMDGNSKSEVFLQDDDPEIVKLMIDYFYCLNYSELAGEDPNSNADPSVAASSEVKKRFPWDWALTIKEKKIKMRSMQLAGTWEDRLTQEAIDQENAERRPAFCGADVSDQVHSDEEMLQTLGQVIIRGGTIIMSTSSTENQTLRLHDLAANTNAHRSIVDARLYALADKYDIEDLKRLAMTKFSNAAKSSWRSEAFVQASRFVFESTPSHDMGLRSIVVNTLHEHPELMDYEEVQELLDSGNGIAWQLVKCFVDRP